MALIFALPQLLHAMDLENESGAPSRYKSQVMALQENYTFNIWALTQIQVKDLTKDDIISLPKDVQRVIGNILYELTKNPVLNGSLMYKKPSDNQQITFMIENLVQEGALDLSRPDFEGKANSLVITLDPKRFFQVNGENANKVVILIAPWSLIMEKIESTAAPFSMIMPQWDKKVAPIGIFWRWGNWNNTQWYEYLTSTKIDIINSKNLFELWETATTTTTSSYTLNPHCILCDLSKYIFFLLF